MPIMTFGERMSFLASQKCVWTYQALRLIDGRLIRLGRNCDQSWATQMKELDVRVQLAKSKKSKFKSLDHCDFFSTTSSIF